MPSKLQTVFDRSAFVFLDGAMGTELQKRGLRLGQKPELAAFFMPETLTAIHAEYLAAGADILIANTFGANPKKLAGTGHTLEETVEASLACARAAGGADVPVALDIGPLGELLAPLRSRTHMTSSPRSCGPARRRAPTSSLSRR